MNKRIYEIIILSVAIIGCDSSPDTPKENLNLVESPPLIASKALQYAIEYALSDTFYEYGGQDPLRSIGIDCSGLVVRCYEYAINDSEYALPFTDAVVIDFYQQWTKQTDNPRSGDLIFMGEDKNKPSHISLFKERKDGRIYFIDSTYKSEDNIDGVSERSYSENDTRFLSFGVLLLFNRLVR